MKKNSLLKNTFFYFANAIITALFNVVINKIFSLFIDPSEYGLYSVVLSIYTLLTSVIFMFYSNTILRFYKDYDNDKRIKVFYSIIIRMLGITTIAYILLSVIIIPILDNYIEDRLFYRLIVLFIIMFIPDGLKQITVSLARCMGEAKKQTAANIIEQIVKIMTFLVCFFLIDKSVSAAIYAGIASAVSAAFMLRKCWILPDRHTKIVRTKKEVIMLLKYGIPLMGIPIINYVLSASDQLIIKIWCGEHATGIYSMGYKIASALLAVVTTFLITATHHLIMESYRKNGRRETESFVKNLSLLYWIISVPFLACTVLFSNTIIEILSSESYAGSSLILSLSSIGIVLCGYVSYTNKPWEVSKRSGMIMVFSAIGAILNIILNIIFIPIFGYVAAAVTTIISYAVVVLLSSLFGRRIMSVSMSLCDFVKVCFVAIIAFGVSLIVKNILPTDGMAGAIFAVTTMLSTYIPVVMFVFKKDIKTTVTRMKNIKG